VIEVSSNASMAPEWCDAHARLIADTPLVDGNRTICSIVLGKCA
jgi:hypothetical protein